jgi:hypothetical protein
MPRYALGTTSDGSSEIYEFADYPSDGAAIEALRKILSEVYPDAEIVAESFDGDRGLEFVVEVAGDYDLEAHYMDDGDAIRTVATLDTIPAK